MVVLIGHFQHVTMANNTLTLAGIEALIGRFIIETYSCSHEDHGRVVAIKQHTRLRRATPATEYFSTGITEIFDNQLCILYVMPRQVAPISYGRSPAALTDPVVSTSDVSSLLANRFTELERAFGVEGRTMQYDWRRPNWPPPSDSQCPFRCFRCRMRSCCRGAPSSEFGLHRMPHLCLRAFAELPCHSDADDIPGALFDYGDYIKEFTTGTCL